MSRWWWGIVALSAGCQSVEYSVGRRTRVDVFHQDRLAAVDLLLVIDNSQSMLDEQQHLADTFDTLIAALEAGNTDWRVAVTTPETSFLEYRASLEGAMDEVILEGGDGTLLDSVAWDDREWAVAEDVAFSRCGPETWEVQPASRGEANPCAAPGAPGPDDGPRPPAPGEVLISELAPRTSDPGCGWLELWNPTSSTLDLSDVVLRDDGHDWIQLPSFTWLEPGETLVWTSFEDCGQADVVDRELHLATGDRWVERATPDGDRVFSELVAVGDGAFGLEMGFENALLALGEPAHPGKDGGFLRPEADLAIVFFSDEDDISPESVDHYIHGFRDLKGTPGHREPERVRLAVVAGIESPTDGTTTSCSSELGQAVFAPRYLALAERAQGPSWSICRELSGVAEAVGLTVSAQTHEFQLSGIPDVDSMTFGIYESEAEDADLIGEPVLGEDLELFTVDGDDGLQQVWMRFEEGVLPPGSVLIVSYEVLPSSSELGDIVTSPVTGASGYR